MFSLIKSLFTGKGNDSELSPVEFITIHADEIALLHPNALFELYKSQKVGFLIKGFLSENEVSSVVNNFEKVETRDVAHIGEGFTYPMVFAEFSNRNSNESKENQKELAYDYFRVCNGYDKEFIDDFGFDMKTKVEKMLSSVSGGRKVNTPKGYDDVGSFPFGNFRYLMPGNGHMPVHCGNFQTEFEPFYTHLNKTLSVEDQMSYFVMLQKPEEGGVLDVFNLRWEAGQTKKSAREDKEIIRPDGSILTIDADKTYSKVSITPEPGDMILFQGGNIWHRVSNVIGQKPRITFGGFMAMDKSEESFYYWT
jgi:hypothetical protein